MNTVMSGVTELAQGSLGDRKAVYCAIYPQKFTFVMEEKSKMQPANSRLLGKRQLIGLHVCTDRMRLA